MLNESGVVAYTLTFLQIVFPARKKVKCSSLYDKSKQTIFFFMKFMILCILVWNFIHAHQLIPFNTFKILCANYLSAALLIYWHYIWFMNQVKCMFWFIRYYLEPFVSCIVQKNILTKLFLNYDMNKKLNHDSFGKLYANCLISVRYVQHL